MYDKGHPWIGMHVCGQTMQSVHVNRTPFSVSMETYSRSKKG